MKSLIEHIIESEIDNTSKDSKLTLIKKYLNAWTVEMTPKPKTITNPMPYTNFLVTCTKKDDIKPICTAIWKIVAEWFGKNKPEEDAINYTTNLWTGAWESSEVSEKERFIKISFDLYDKPENK